MYGCGKDCLILIPFRLPQISCVTLSLKCFSSDSDNCPHVGIGPLFQFPNPLRAGPVLLTLLFCPPSSFILTSFAWVYISFSTAQVLLLALSRCSACTCVGRCISDVSVETDVLHVHLLCMTQHCYLSSMAARLSSIGISPSSLLPHIPSICLLCLPGDQHSCKWCMVVARTV